MPYVLLIDNLVKYGYISLFCMGIVWIYCFNLYHKMKHSPMLHSWAEIGLSLSVPLINIMRVQMFRMERWHATPNVNYRIHLLAQIIQPLAGVISSGQMTR